MHRLPWSALLLIVLSFQHAATSAAEHPEWTVPLPAGETLLQDIGIYRVGWQSYGKEPVEMPLAWAGHFDSRTGISYLPWGKVLGREALLMHSPWHVPPGKTWADYQLALPAATPIRFQFGIAMGPDVAVPDKSDGVTFSCYLTADGPPRELLRQHYDRGHWQDFQFDLSPYTGKTVTLRLQVEPGPKNNASFDYSFFGDAKIAVGESRPDPAELVKTLIATPAYQATAAASRVALSNSPAAGIVPGNLLPADNRVEEANGVWRFQYQGGDCRVVYTYRPDTGTLDDFTVQVDDGRPFQPASNGGATAVVQPAAAPAKPGPDGRPAKPAAAVEQPLRGGRLIEAKLARERLQVLWEYDLSGRPLRVAWTFGIRGKALTVAAACDEPVVSEFSLGNVALAPLRKLIPVPYLAGHVHYLPVQRAAKW